MNSRPYRTSPGQCILEPSQKAIKVLNEISKDERNTVVIISSQMKNFLSSKSCRCFHPQT